MNGLVLKWTGAARNEAQQRIRDLFPLEIPVVRCGKSNSCRYELDQTRVYPGVVAKCREIAFGQIDDKERRQRLMTAPIVVADADWLAGLGLVEGTAYCCAEQMSLF